MEKNGLLKDIQDFFKTTKQDIIFMENEIEFREILKVLDADAIKELIAKGFSITEFEQEHGSTLIRAIFNSSDIMLSVFKKYWPKEYIRHYCEAFPKMGFETLPAPLKDELSNITKSLISTMDVLYENGADINKSGVQVEDSSVMGILLDRTSTIQTSSSFGVAIQCLDYLKSSEVVKWFIQKQEFQLKGQKNIVSTLVRLDSNLSTEVLEMLLQNGLPLENYFITSDADRYSSLHECAIAGGAKTRNDKMQLLYQFATPEQKLRYNQDYEMILATQNIENQTNYSK